MQFSIWLDEVTKLNKSIKRTDYDCASCKGENHKCLKYNREVQLVSPNLPMLTEITVDTYGKAFEAYAEAVGSDDTPLLFVLIEYGLCPIPLFKKETLYYMELFTMLNGFGHADYFSVQRYPAKYVDYVNLIRSLQTATINKLRGAHNAN